MTEQRKERGWPMLVISTGGVIHISRANAPHGKVKCDCGRTIEHRGNIANTNLDELEASDGKTVTFYDRWTYKFCQRCGSKEDFIEAQKKSIKALAENKERREAKWDAEQKELAKTQAAVRSLPRYFTASLVSTMSSMTAGASPSPSGVIAIN
jgi:hypothetical protein